MKTDVSVRDIDTGVQVWDTCTVRVSVLCWSCQMVWSVGVLVQGLGHPDSPSPAGCCCTYSLLLHPPSSAPRLQLHRGQAADTTAHCTASQTTSARLVSLSTYLAPVSKHPFVSHTLVYTVIVIARPLLWLHLCLQQDEAELRGERCVLGWRGAAQSHHYQLYRDVLRARPRRGEVGRLIEAIEDVMTSECRSDGGD